MSQVCEMEENGRTMANKKVKNLYINKKGIK
jgi:hypothetical protein